MDSLGFISKILTEPFENNGDYISHQTWSQCKVCMGLVEDISIQSESSILNQVLYEKCPC